MAFATLALAELGLVYGMRSTTAAAWQAPRNCWLDASVLASAAVVAVAVYLPGVRSAFAAVPLGPAAGAIVLALALVPLVAVELYKAHRRSRAASGSRPPARRVNGTRATRRTASSSSPR